MHVKIKPLDKKWSDYIRAKAGWRCERCGNTPARRGLHCHHFHRRRKMSTRYDEDNCLSLCLGCHQFFGENRDIEIAFMAKKLGQKAFDDLQIRSQLHWKVDEQAVKLYLKEKLKDLEDANVL